MRTRSPFFSFVSENCTVGVVAAASVAESVKPARPARTNRRVRRCIATSRNEWAMPDYTAADLYGAPLPGALLARQLLIAHRQLIREGGHDGCGLLEVLSAEAVEDVHVRVRRGWTP